MVEHAVNHLANYQLVFYYLVRHAIAYDKHAQSKPTGEHLDRLSHGFYRYRARLKIVLGRCGGSAPVCLYNELTTTHSSTGSEQTFQVTHPFHPLYGRQYELIDTRCTWGENRVYYYDDQKQLKTLLLSWTNLQPLDPFTALSSGRASFRTEDLLALIALFKSIPVD